MRSAYNALELAVLSSFTTDDKAAEITLEIAEECLQKRASFMIKVEMLIMTRIIGISKIGARKRCKCSTSLFSTSY